jgi:hypothetical protein
MQLRKTVRILLILVVGFVIMPTTLIFVYIVHVIPDHSHQGARSYSPDGKAYVYFVSDYAGSFATEYSAVLAKGLNVSYDDAFSGISASDSQNVSMRFIWVDSHHLRVICSYCDDFVPNTMKDQWKDISISYSEDKEGMPPLKLKYKPWR